MEIDICCGTALEQSIFAGILSQGLRIAPPEAPVNGYMFGKGIYTSDMVSKSANYCNSTSEGLLVLCDVALGQIQEEKQASNIRKPKKPNNSVKGIGSTFPNPEETITTKEGVKVPCGKAITKNEKNLSLLYNEYIVYDEAQIMMKYLVQVNIEYDFNLSWKL